MHWKTNEDDVDLYDCRTRPWFIEAATCAKDIIVLMDNSGSMTGMRNTIAKLVVKSILDTFGNNDFINVLKFSWTAEPVLSCYSDTLVQATAENVEMFQEAVTNVKPEGNASFPNAFATAFQILEKVISFIWRKLVNVTHANGILFSSLKTQMRTSRRQIKPLCL